MKVPWLFVLSHLINYLICLLINTYCRFYRLLCFYSKNPNSEPLGSKWLHPLTLFSTGLFLSHVCYCNGLSLKQRPFTNPLTELRSLYLQQHEGVWECIKALLRCLCGVLPETCIVFMSREIIIFYKTFLKLKEASSRRKYVHSDGQIWAFWVIHLVENDCTEC